MLLFFRNRKSHSLLEFSDNQDSCSASHFDPVRRMSCALSRAGTRRRKGKQARERLLPTDTATAPTLGALYYIELFLRSLMSNTLQNVLAKILLYYSSLRAKSLCFLYEISGPIVSENNNLWFEFYSCCMFRESEMIKTSKLSFLYVFENLEPKKSLKFCLSLCMLSLCGPKLNRNSR